MSTNNVMDLTNNEDEPALNDVAPPTPPPKLLAFPGITKYCLQQFAVIRLIVLTAVVQYKAHQYPSGHRVKPWGKVYEHLWTGYEGPDNTL